MAHPFCNIVTNLVTISEKKMIETQYIFIKKPIKMFDLLNNTQTFPFLLTHCCAKPEKSLPGS